MHDEDMGTSEEFYEPDEPVEDVLAAFARGEKRVTVVPSRGLTAYLRIPGLLMTKPAADQPTQSTSRGTVRGFAA